VAAEYLALQSSTKVAALSAKECEAYNYIYPVVRVSELNHSGIWLMFRQVAGAANDRILKRSQPYRNQRIVNVIHDLYFTGGEESFATSFNHRFTSYRVCSCF
jgi:hypothetical protein